MQVSGKNTVTYWLVGGLLLVSAIIIGFGCQKNGWHGGPTTPHTAAPILLNLAKGGMAHAKVMNLIISAAPNGGGGTTLTQSFAEPVFPLNLNLSLTIPPCQYTFTATATGPDGNTITDSATVDVCTFAGSGVVLRVLAGELTPTPTGTVGEPTATPTITPTPTALPREMVVVTKTGTGSGLVTSDPAGINCGLVCASKFSNGVWVTLSASPATGSTFVGWSRSDCSGTGTCRVFVEETREVTAAFELNNYTVTTATTGTGAGSVTGGGTYPYGTTVNLTATANTGSMFTQWASGPCAGMTTNSCSFTITANISANAEFLQMLTFAGATHTEAQCGAAGGTVVTAGGGTQCRFTQTGGNAACPGGWTATGYGRFATNAQTQGIDPNYYFCPGFAERYNPGNSDFGNSFTRHGVDPETLPPTTECGCSVTSNVCLWNGSVSDDYTNNAPFTLPAGDLGNKFLIDIGCM